MIQFPLYEALKTWLARRQVRVCAQFWCQKVCGCAHLSEGASTLAFQTDDRATPQIEAGS